MVKSYRGSCHCGAVQFEASIDLAAGTSRCNCAICARTRFWKVVVGAGDFQLLAGDDSLSEYRFGSGAIHHQFCRVCGVKTFGTGRIEATGPFVAINVACLDAADEELAAAPITYEDGRHNDWLREPTVTRHL